MAQDLLHHLPGVCRTFVISCDHLRLMFATLDALGAFLKSIRRVRFKADEPCEPSHQKIPRLVTVRLQHPARDPITVVFRTQVERRDGLVVWLVRGATSLQGSTCHCQCL